MTVRQVIYVGIISLCIILALLQLFRQRIKGLTTLLFRLTGGVVGILCANSILGILGMPAVGLNLFSLSILGGLGIPGVVLLYLLLNIQNM